MADVQIEILLRLMIEGDGQCEPNLDLLERAVNALPDPEKTVLENYYGLLGCGKKKSQEIADMLGVSTDDIRNILLSALKLLRRPSELLNKEN